MKRKTLAIILVLTCMATAAFSKDKKPLHNGYYNAKQLRKRGYNVHFKGSIFLTFKKYLEINKL